MWYSLSASVALLCIASAVHVQSLDLKTAKDQPCFNIPNPKTPILDEKWVHSINPMYFPVGSTNSLYRVALNVLQKEARDVGFATVYYDACLKWYMYDNGTVVSTGFNGLRKEYKTKTLEDNPDAFTFVGEGGDKDFYSGTLYTTLTDNKSFFFATICLKNGEMAWGVASTTPTLTEETKKKVFDHAVSLGFNKEDFTELKYDTCKN
ncbi:unnamed protein product [Orchesella dallaii]|uniref:Uncharacterized protein n=1 Tax=Orchesella dallaii TaxID=48710 RepID=A0ABP1R0N7_9HEXA